MSNFLILGSQNHSLTAIFQMLADITGLPAPRFRVPYGVIWLAALAMEGVARLSRKPPQVPLTGVRMARKHMYFSAEKAVRELGLPQTSIARARRKGSPPGTLLSLLLDTCGAEGNRQMSDGELHDELKAFLVAGHTTTASALAWVWYALAGNSAVEKQLKRELRAVLEERPPGAQDLHALHYTRMLIKEVLRLYPPTWVTARTPMDDDEIGGYRIAADAIVLLSPFVTHRHPGFWEDPERFDPERFSPERSAARPPFAYFPFGGGPRSCIGGGFAPQDHKGRPSACPRAFGAE